jgi:hypothetical protein
MAKWSDYDQRTLANHQDVRIPVTATINKIGPEPMPRDGKIQLVIRFPEHEFRFGVQLNKTRRDALRDIVGSDNPDNAVGVTIELYEDMTVRNPSDGSMGGIGIRRPSTQGRAIDFGEKPKPKGAKK